MHLICYITPPCTLPKRLPARRLRFLRGLLCNRTLLFNGISTCVWHISPHFSSHMIIYSAVPFFFMPCYNIIYCRFVLSSQGETPSVGCSCRRKDFLFFIFLKKSTKIWTRAGKGQRRTLRPDISEERQSMWWMEKLHWKKQNKSIRTTRRMGPNAFCLSKSFSSS